MLTIAMSGGDEGEDDALPRPVLQAASPEHSQHAPIKP
jgi:hypothetical protein